MSECCCCRADTASLSTRRSVECVWVLERQRGKRQVAVNAESSSSGPYLSPPSSSNYTCSFLLFFLSFFFVGGAKKLASFRPAAFERSNAGLDDEGGDHRWRWWKKVMLCVAVLCSLRMAVRRDSQKPFNDPAAAADHEERTKPKEMEKNEWKSLERVIIAGEEKEPLLLLGLRVHVQLEFMNASNYISLSFSPGRTIRFTALIIYLTSAWTTQPPKNEYSVPKIHQKEEEAEKLYSKKCFIYTCEVIRCLSKSQDELAEGA